MCLALQLLLFWLPLGAPTDVHNLTADFPGCTPVAVPMKTFVPIFMLTRDRITTTQKTIRSYHQSIRSPWELVILDHESSYPPMLKYLQELEASKIPVIHIPFCEGNLDKLMELVADAVAGYLKPRPQIEYYVLTDPDIQFQHMPSDVLIFFVGLLTSCPNITVVGPSLRISNIPDSYARKAQALEAEETFWQSPPYTATWKNQLYNFAKQPLDTTFAMRRASRRFSRGLLGNPVRTYAPYMALHSDWYINVTDPGPDYVWYRDFHNGFSHYA